MSSIARCPECGGDSIIYERKQKELEGRQYVEEGRECGKCHTPLVYQLTLLSIWEKYNEQHE